MWRALAGLSLLAGAFTLPVVRYGVGTPLATRLYQRRFEMRCVGCIV